MTEPTRATGATICAASRSVAASHGADTAAVTLRCVVPALTDEQIAAILDGKATLEGDSIDGVTYVETEPTP